MHTYFVDVILPLAVPKNYTYRLPKNLAEYAEIGKRVVVPFGRSKLYTGIVASVHENPPKAYTAKYIDSFLDSHPVVSQNQLDLWKWMAEYYMCNKGEVLIAALPSGLRLSSETIYMVNPAFDGDVSGLSSRELLLLDAFATQEILDYKQISQMLDLKNINPVMKKLIESGAVMIRENLKEGYKPKKESFLSLPEYLAKDEALESAFDQLKRAPKQQEALMLLLQNLSADKKMVKKSLFKRQHGIGDSVLKELVRKEIITEVLIETDRIRAYEGEVDTLPKLSSVQGEVLGELKTSFQSKSVALLKGVTSSGKTEIYTHLISEVLASKRQVLYMVPEIALTAQLINRLRRFFGDDVLVYHSKFNQNERVEIWNKVLKGGKGQVILGARSSVFLPFKDLGLIIVDEEHESSFKQYDPAPRYNARDVGIVLASFFKAKVLLGSATPSYESLFNAQNGKFAYSQLLERYDDRPKPDLELVSLKQSTKGSGYFTQELVDEVSAALGRKEQVILFQNRRGYSPLILCEVCGWTPECTRCDVSLTYHKSTDRLVCHYCGNKYTVPPTCSACGSNKMTLAGSGTERIEEDVQILFPEAQVARLDLDSTSSKLAYQKIIGDFEDGLIDILIGTQMVTKGLDFDNVRMAAVLNADLLMKFPDFRANERTYQLVTQVAGRAGRRDTKGRVLIQSYDPGQWLLQQIKESNDTGVFEHEMSERQKFLYPPYARIIKLTFKHKQAELVDFCSAKYHEELTRVNGISQILGPEYPYVSRIKNQYLKVILLKVKRELNISKVKSQLKELNQRFFSQSDFKAVRLVIDVDPQ